MGKRDWFSCGLLFFAFWNNNRATGRCFLGCTGAGQSTDKALKSAWGTFVGLLLGRLLNVIAAGVMGYYFFANL
jgi:hypothetical protein